MSFTCNFCDNNFKTNILLKQHQTTIKYCLKLQEKKDEKLKFIYQKNEGNFRPKSRV